MNVKQANETVAKLAALKFFPSDTVARVALVGLICEMARTNEQIDWLIRRMLLLYNEWPGPREMRACFCSKFPPKDGIEAKSGVFLDGVPSEKAANAAPLLTPGKEEARRLLAMAAEPIEALPAIRRPAPRRRVEAAPVNPNFKPITQADVDRELARQREARAKAEAGL